MTVPTGLPQELVNPRNVKLGTIDCYIGAEDTAYTATGANWLYCGIIDPATFTTNAPKQSFVMKTGFPATTKVVAISMVDMQIDFTLREMTPQARELCAGSGTSALTYATSPVATTVASATSTTSFTLTSATNYAVGQFLEVALSTGKEYVYIEALAGAVVTCQPPLSAQPSGGEAVKAVKTAQNAIGSQEVPRKAFKMVFTDNHLETCVLHVPGFSPTGNFAPKWSDTTKDTVLPVQLTAYGKSQTWNGIQQSIVGFLYQLYQVVS